MKRSVVWLALLVCSCQRQRLTAPECRELLGRITQLELAERGFRDPALVARRRVELQTLLAPELRACQGRRVRPGALACARQAHSAEELSHRCLR